MTNQNTLVPTILLAAATGARSMTGLAATAQALRLRDPAAANAQPARFVSAAANTVSALAAMELVADKLPGIPNRTDALPILGRAAAGALIGAAIAVSAGRDRATGAAVGSAAALVAAHLSFHGRRVLAERVPATVAAIVEDVTIGCIAAAGVAAMNGEAAQ